MAAYELRPMFEDLEVPEGSDFTYESAEYRDDHPNRYFYEVEEDAFGRLPRIYIEFRGRAEMDDNLRLVGDVSSRALARTRVTLDSGRYRDWINYLFQIQDSRASFSESPEDQIDRFDFRQAFVSISQPRAVWGVKVGRLELDFGSGRLVGADWHSSVDRSFDGARFSLSDRWDRFEPRQWSWRADVFAALPVSMTSGFNETHDDPSIAGVFYSDRRGFPVLAEATLLLTEGMNDDPTPVMERLFTVGGRIWADHIGRANGLGFELESAVQGGEVGDESHSALLAAASVSYTFPTPWRVEVHAGTEYGTGDSDPADGRSEGFRSLFPGDMRRYTGVTGYLGQRNVLIWNIGGSFGPLVDFRIGGDVRWLRLNHLADAWHDVYGLNTTAVADRDLGWEAAVYGRYNLVTESGREMWFEGGYAVLEPGAAFVTPTGTVQVLYMQVTFRF
jgi:hypothetical protein